MIFRRLLPPRLRIAAERLQTEGSEGADIRTFQQILNRYTEVAGVSVPLTGVYDEATRAAVRALQHRELNVRNTDGFVGPQTANLLRIKLLGDQV